MRLSSITMTSLVGGRPRLEYEKPILEDGKWLVSGKMIVEFKPTANLSDTAQVYGGAKGLTIEAPFSRSVGEDDAVKQASQYLEKIGSEIAQVGMVLLGKSGQPQ